MVKNVSVIQILQEGAVLSEKYTTQFDSYDAFRLAPFLGIETFSTSHYNFTILGPNFDHNFL